MNIGMFATKVADFLMVWFLGIADQLQSNFASDLRHILKTVFNCNTLSSEPTTSVSTKSTSIGGMNGLSPISGTSNSVARMDNIESLGEFRRQTEINKSRMEVKLFTKFLLVIDMLSLYQNYYSNSWNFIL